MKKILIFGIILLSTFLIYLATLDRKVYYLSLGDSLALGATPYGGHDYGYSDYVKDYINNKKKLEKYINSFANDNYRTIDLMNDIKNNKTIIYNNKKVSIKNALIKADLITLSIGSNDFLSYITIRDLNSAELYKYLDEVIVDIEALFKLMREYCKEDIIYIGLYNYFNIDMLDPIIEYGNQRLKVICENYDIKYIDTYTLFKTNIDYLPNPLDIHPSKLGYTKIGEMITEAFFD